jgi:hypothetical protein
MAFDIIENGKEWLIFPTTTSSLNGREEEGEHFTA